MAPPRNRTRRSAHGWQLATGLVAFGVASVGCAAPSPVAIPAANGGATADGLMVAPLHPGAFPVMERNGQLVCTGCNSVLNRDGSHQLAQLLIQNLKNMKSGDYLKAPLAKPGQRTMKEFIPYALLKLGMGKHMGLTDPKVASAALASLEAKPFDYTRTAATRQLMDACCIPDGVPATDPPY